MLRFKLIILVVLACTGCCTSIQDKANEQWIQFPLSLLSVESALKFNKHEITNLVEYQSVSFAAKQYADCEYDNSLCCIIILWLNGFRGTVESLWYEKDDRFSRSLIMLLILSDLEDDRIESFVHECNRYEHQERALRLEEIKLIERHRLRYANIVRNFEKTWQKTD